jgi:UDP-glucuronate 4-epimerase
MTTLVTGAAGFIGYHLCQALLKRGDKVLGLDNLNPYYDIGLKESRINRLKSKNRFSFYAMNVEDRQQVATFIAQHPEIDNIVHLAAQAGVRYSIENPHVYADSNLLGHLNMLEACRSLPHLKHFVYASSSSVYGANQKLPFSVQDPVEQPISLYAATKRSCELMSHTYSHLFGIPSSGLRFFTVYGPWGRPDMSAFLFTKAILSDQELAVFNHGDMRRNFTFIDDVIQGTVACLDNPPLAQQSMKGQANEQIGEAKEMLANDKQKNIIEHQIAEQTLAPHRIYNIGNNRTEPLMYFIETLENIIGKKAKIRFEGMQPGDVKETIADITESTRDFGFMPKTNIEVGLEQFVSWYRSYYGI